MTLNLAGSIPSAYGSAITRGARGSHGRRTDLHPARGFCLGQLHRAREGGRDGPHVIAIREVRLFDDLFTLDDVRQANVDLLVEGPEGYRLEGTNAMGQISRDPAELVRQCLCEHRYPDGFVLFCGTLFAPTQDRGTPGAGFTHKVGDVVTISSRRIGTLRNAVTASRDAPPWTMGMREFARNLAWRGLNDRI